MGPTGHPGDPWGSLGIPGGGWLCLHDVKIDVNWAISYWLPVISSYIQLYQLYQSYLIMALNKKKKQLYTSYKYRLTPFIECIIQTNNIS